MRHSVRSASCALVLLVARISAPAADLLWDFSPGTPGAQDGSGEWNTTNSNWLVSSTQNTSWTNAPLNNAVFGSGAFAGTVSVTEPITVGNITFNPTSVATYSLIGAPVTLSTDTRITANQDAQIGAPLGGFYGFTKLGSGSLTLSGASNYSGVTNLNVGTLQLLGGDNRLPVSTTLRFGGSATLQMNAVSQIVGGLVANGQTASIIGSGTLTVSGDLRVGSNQASSTTTLDLSQLTNFAFNSPAATFDVGAQSTQDRAGGVIKLAAASNTILAATVQVGNTTIGAASAKGIAELKLGQTNRINAGSLTIGGVKNSGLIAFTAGVTNSSLTLRGPAASERTDVSIGISDAIAGDYGGDGVLDTRAGSFDAKIDTLVLGQNNNGERSASGQLLMSAGTLDATNIVLGRRISSSTGAGSPAGQLDVDGGTVLARTITFADKQDPGAGGTVSGVFNLLGGKVKAERIQAGGGAGTVTRLIRWVAGEIRNYDANTDLAITGVDIVAESNASHPLFAEIGRTITVNSGVSGNISKEGSGTLVLAGTGNTSLANITANTGTVLLTKASYQVFPAASSVSLNSGTTLQFGAPEGNYVSTLISNGGTLDLNGKNGSVGTLTGESTALITNTASTPGEFGIGGGTFAGSIRDGAAPVALRVSDGTLILSGENTYSGKTTVESGTLSIDSDNRLGVAPATPIGDHLTILFRGTLRASRSFALDPNRGVMADGVFDVDPGVELTIPKLSGSQIAKRGEGILIISDAGYRGPIHIYSGAIRLAGGTVLPGNVDMGRGARLELAGNYNVTQNLSFEGGLTLASVQGNSVVSGGILLKGDPIPDPRFPLNTLYRSRGIYAIQVDSGATLEVNSNISSEVTFGGLGALQLQGNGTGSLRATMPAGLGITKRDVGTWTLNVAVPDATVSGGTLALGLGGSLQSVVVETEGTLDASAFGAQLDGPVRGSGLVKGNVIVRLLSPGPFAPDPNGPPFFFFSHIGTLTFAGELRLNGQTEMQIFKSGSAPVADLVNVVGGLTLGGNLSVKLFQSGGEPFTQGDRFNLFDATSFAANFAEFDLPPLSQGLSWDASNIPIDGTLLVVPEPGTAWLTLPGLLMFLVVRRPGRRAASGRCAQEPRTS